MLATLLFNSDPSTSWSSLFWIPFFQWFNTISAPFSPRNHNSSIPSKIINLQNNQSSSYFESTNHQCGSSTISHY